MCKLTLIDKTDENNILAAKHFTDEAKATAIKRVLDKYTDPEKLEVRLEIKAKNTHGGMRGAPTNKNLP